MNPTQRPGPITHREEARPSGDNRWRVPPYGYVDTVELVLEEPLPNMDANGFFEIHAFASINGAVINFTRCYVRSRAVVMDERS